MYNMTIRKLINDVEKNLEALKNDYERLENIEKENIRRECLSDIKLLRTNLNTMVQKIKDLIWVKNV